MTSLDEILAELAQIRERLEADIDASEYAVLTERREALRRLARESAPETGGDLRCELDRLVAAWERLQVQRIDVVKQAGDLAAGNFGFTSDAMAINRNIDAAAGRDALEQRIRDLKAKLEGFDS